MYIIIIISSQNNWTRLSIYDYYSSRSLISFPRCFIIFRVVKEAFVYNELSVRPRWRLHTADHDKHIYWHKDCRDYIDVITALRFIININNTKITTGSSSRSSDTSTITTTFTNISISITTITNPTNTCSNTTNITSTRSQLWLTYNTYSIMLYFMNQS